MKVILIKGHLSFALAMMLSNVAIAADESADLREAAVWRDVAAKIAVNENSAQSGPPQSVPFNAETYYPESEFVLHQIEVAAATKGLCGLSPADSAQVVESLKKINAAPINIADHIGHIPLVEFQQSPPLNDYDYFGMSRVYFDPAGMWACLSVDISKASGIIMRVDKTEGGWVPVSERFEWVTWQ